jgi:hypothetical protein
MVFPSAERACCFGLSILPIDHLHTLLRGDDFMDLFDTHTRTVPVCTQRILKRFSSDVASQRPMRDSSHWFTSTVEKF